MIYARVENDTVAAWATAGEQLRRLKVPKLAWEINELSVGPERMYGITGDGRAVCLG